MAVLGIVWLVRSATIDGQNAADEGPVSSVTGSNGTDPNAGTDPDADPGTGTGRSDDGDSNSPSTSQGSSTAGNSTPGGETRKSDRRSIHVNGVRLDGNRNGPGCLTIINKTATAGTIDSVSFTATGPATPAIRSDDAAHCSPTGDPACRGINLTEGDQCVAGAVLPSDAPAGVYTVTAVVHFTYLCDNAENSPCNEVPHWGGSPPTSQNPVQISGSSSNHVPTLTMTVGGAAEDTPPEEFSPPSPDTDSPEEFQPPPDEPLTGEQG
ncbi:hypothetical protein [Streptomyces sp. WM6386]|uniref:hypothetical protein n=1 Tax=Streptomyces sp. WM6386 TaxID=1415558 RepID=UPI00131E7235|nr:hypothetical protein [Streptomyces sp. WM6386]